MEKNIQHQVKWFLAREAGGAALPDEEWAVKAKTLKEAAAKVSLFNAVIVRELDPDEVA